MSTQNPNKVKRQKIALTSLAFLMLTSSLSHASYELREEDQKKLQSSTCINGKDTKVSINYKYFFTEIENEKEEYSAFIRDSLHHDKMNYDIRKNLINKGYQVLQDISKGKTLHLIAHKNKFFPDAGNEYATAYIPHMPTRKSLVNTSRYLWEWMGYPKSEDFEYQKTLSRRAKLESLVSIIWALADYAAAIKQPFSSGSFSIIDPDKKFFNFFADYAIAANNIKSLDQLPEGICNSFNPKGSLFAYNRKPENWSSSHYNQSTIEQIGIDARFESTASALGILPYQATHILVGDVKTYSGREKTFIKFEPHGIGDISSWFMHSVNYITSSNREGKRSEKDIPKVIIKKYEDLLKSLPGSNRDPKYDIASMVEFSTKLKGSIKDKDTENKINDFLKEIEDTYHDNITNSEKIYFRTGNEVVIDLREIRKN